MDLILALATVIGALIVPMEITHRRTRSLPRLTQLERFGIRQWW